MFKTLLAVDNNLDACNTYILNVDADEVVCAPVGTITPHLRQGDADVLIGGPPCQPFSEAGAQQGDEDERNGIPAYCEGVRNLMPRQFLMENVRGLIRKKHKPYFDAVCEQLAGYGYDVQWRLIDAVNYGVPQFRKRVFVWGIRNDIDAAHLWPEETHAWPWVEGRQRAVTVGWALDISHMQVDGVRYVGGDSELCKVMGGGSNPRVSGGKRIENDITNRPSTTLATDAGNAMPWRWSDKMLQKQPPFDPSEPAKTLLVRIYKGGAGGLLKIEKSMREPSPTISAGGTDTGGAEPIRHGGLRVRRLSPDECSRLMSMPDDFKWPNKISKTARYKIIGNGQASLLMHKFAQCMKATDPISTSVISLFCGGGVGDIGFHGNYWQYVPKAVAA